MAALWENIDLNCMVSLYKLGAILKLGHQLSYGDSFPILTLCPTQIGYPMHNTVQVTCLATASI